MQITEEHVGAIVRRPNAGERFQITAVCADSLSIQKEDGTQAQIAGHVVDGEVERDEAATASFQTKLALSLCLNAAEQATKRRLQPHSSDQLTVEEATRVSQLVQQQRQALFPTPSLDARLQSAQDRCTKPHNRKEARGNLGR